MSPTSFLFVVLMVVMGSAGAQRPPTSQQEQQLLAVVEAARERVEFHSGQEVKAFVIGPAIDEEVGAVLRRALGAIAPDKVPRDVTYELPPRYLLLKSLSVHGERATFTGTMGPVPAPREGVVHLSCGTTFNIDVTKVADRWVAKVASLVEC